MMLVSHWGSMIFVGRGSLAKPKSKQNTCDPEQMCMVVTLCFHVLMFSRYMLDCPPGLGGTKRTLDHS